MVRAASPKPKEEVPQTSGGNKKVYISTNYNYYLGSAKQASDYETTTEFLINYIKKLYDYGKNDIGTRSWIAEKAL